MCGRFALTASEAEIVDHFNLQTTLSMRPRYNIAPGDTIPAILSLGKLEFFQWGFIPGWRKCEMGNEPQRFINARIESVSEKPSFKRAFKTQRCLIPANGYFEWKLIGKKKQPYYVFPDNKAILGLAGIWDAWFSPEGVKCETVAILTQPASESLLTLHERMPVIISKSDYLQWLNPKNKLEALTELLNSRSLPLSYYPVPTAVNNPRFDQAACLQRL